MSEPHTHEELGLPKERQGRRAPADLLERRRGFRALADLQIGDPIATVQTRTIADVDCIEVAGRAPRGLYPWRRFPLERGKGVGGPRHADGCDVYLTYWTKGERRAG